MQSNQQSGSNYNLTYFEGLISRIWQSNRKLLLKRELLFTDTNCSSPPFLGEIFFGDACGAATNYTNYTNGYFRD